MRASDGAFRTTVTALLADTSRSRSAAVRKRKCVKTEMTFTFALWSSVFCVS